MTTVKPDIHAQIMDGGEATTIFEIMQRFRVDGSCELLIEKALDAYAAAQRPPTDPVPVKGEPRCAGLDGCQNLEGVMHDLFVHDPNCPKGTSKPFSEVRKELIRTRLQTGAQGEKE